MEDKINLEISQNDVYIILNGLSELPYKISATLISNIMAQVNKVNTSE